VPWCFDARQLAWSREFRDNLVGDVRPILLPNRRCSRLGDCSFDALPRSRLFPPSNLSIGGDRDDATQGKTVPHVRARRTRRVVCLAACACCWRRCAFGRPLRRRAAGRGARRIHQPGSEVAARRAQVRSQHGRPGGFGLLAQGVPGDDGGDGSDRRLLDPALRVARAPGVSP
jgi:hypothetical protein